MKIGIIGAGAMGGAVARGLAESGMTASDICVANPSPGKLREFADMGMRTTSDNAEAASCADIVVIAVKPWILPAVAEELRAVIDPAHQQVAVIVAGVSGEELLKMFGRQKGACNLAIVMPNTAMTLRESMTFIVNVSGATPLADSVFCRLGAVKDIEERLLPAATALASCGIAYALRYIRAAVEGGVELGFRASDAQEIVTATVRGAAALLSVDGAHPEVEIDRVTTAGGITIRGLNAMEQAGFTPAVIAGLKASR